MKLPDFTFYGGREHKTPLSFSFPELRYSSLEFISRENCQHLINWTPWNKRDNVWGSATSLFKWRFRSRHRRRWLSSLMTHDTVKAKIPEMLKKEIGWVTFTPVLEFINKHCIIKKQEKHTEIITLTKKTASKSFALSKKKGEGGFPKSSFKKVHITIFLNQINLKHWRVKIIQFQSELAYRWIKRRNASDNYCEICKPCLRMPRSFSVLASLDSILENKIQSKKPR